MFQMKDEMQTAVKHNIRGGEGSPSFRYLFSAEQLGGRALENDVGFAVRLVRMHADGHTHSIRNHTAAPTRFLAVIVPNK